jgi:hypothetical protein
LAHIQGLQLQSTAQLCLCAETLLEPHDYNTIALLEQVCNVLQGVVTLAQEGIGSTHVVVEAAAEGVAAVGSEQLARGDTKAALTWLIASVQRDRGTDLLPCWQSQLAVLQRECVARRHHAQWDVDAG